MKTETSKITQNQVVVFVLFGIILAVFLFAGGKDSSANEKDKMIQYAYDILDSYFDDSLNIQSPSFKKPDDYYRLYISLIYNGVLRCSQSGLSKKEGWQRLSEDIKEGVTKCIEDERFGGSLKEDELEKTSIVFNFLKNQTELSDVNERDLEESIELGIHGLEVSGEKSRAFFKESVPISKNYSLSYTIERLCKKANLGENCLNNSGTTLYRYDTSTFIGAREGNPIDLYRYNILVEEKDLTEEFIFRRLELAHQWFGSTINKNTDLLEYKYYPSKNKYSSSNNHIRQLAALWAVASLGNFLDDHTLDDLVERTITEYMKYKEEYFDKNNYAFLMIEDEAEIAYNAFLILILLETEYPDKEELLAMLAEGLLFQQNEDGSYNTYFQSDKNSGQDYYPGESILALMRLYQETGEERYRQSVEKAFPFYRDYWRNNINTAFIPWQSQALALLYEYSPNDEIADFIFEMNDWIIDTHQIVETKYPDLMGAFTRSRPRNSTSSYIEGINSAYKIAKEMGDTKHIRKYDKAIRGGARFILQTQFTPENSFYIKNRNRAIGGFRESLTENDLRIDYAQHASFALMRALEQGIF